jgi:hypothetical protein
MGILQSSTYNEFEQMLLDQRIAFLYENVINRLRSLANNVNDVGARNELRNAINNLNPRLKRLFSGNYAVPAYFCNSLGQARISLNMVAAALQENGDAKVMGPDEIKIALSLTEHADMLVPLYKILQLHNLNALLNNRTAFETFCDGVSSLATWISTHKWWIFGAIVFVGPVGVAIALLPGEIAIGTTIGLTQGAQGLASLANSAAKLKAAMH